MRQSHSAEAATSRVRDRHLAAGQFLPAMPRHSRRRCLSCCYSDRLLPTSPTALPPTAYCLTCHATETGEQLFQVGGQRGLDGDGLPGDRVDEAQVPGVEGLAADRERESGGLARPVDPVAEDRMADLGQVDPDLVGPAGLEPAGQQAGRLAEALQRPRSASRPRRPRGLGPGHPAAAVAPVGDQGQVDPAGRGQEDSLDDGEVDTRSIAWSRNMAWNGRSDRAAVTSRIAPEVSWSSRCTIPTYGFRIPCFRAR